MYASQAKNVRLDEITTFLCFQLAIASDGACEESERSPAAEALLYHDETAKARGKGKRQEIRGQLGQYLLVEIFGISPSR